MWTYIIKTNRRFKIGISKRLLGRLKDIRARNPDIVELVAAAKFKEDKEAELHQRYNEKQLNGEWFSLTEDDVKDLRYEFLQARGIVDEKDLEKFLPVKTRHIKKDRKTSRLEIRVLEDDLDRWRYHFGKNANLSKIIRDYLDKECGVVLKSAKIDELLEEPIYDNI